MNTHAYPSYLPGNPTQTTVWKNLQNHLTVKSSQLDCEVQNRKGTESGQVGGSMAYKYTKVSQFLADGSRWTKSYSWEPPSQQESSTCCCCCTLAASDAVATAADLRCCRAGPATHQGGSCRAGQALSVDLGTCHHNVTESFTFPIFTFIHMRKEKKATRKLFSQIQRILNLLVLRWCCHHVFYNIQGLHC